MYNMAVCDQISTHTELYVCKQICTKFTLLYIVHYNSVTGSHAEVKLIRSIFILSQYQQINDATKDAISYALSIPVPYPVPNCEYFTKFREA